MLLSLHSLFVNSSTWSGRHFPQLQILRPHQRERDRPGRSSEPYRFFRQSAAQKGDGVLGQHGGRDARDEGDDGVGAFESALKVRRVRVVRTDPRVFEEHVEKAWADCPARARVSRWTYKRQKAKETHERRASLPRLQEGGDRCEQCPIEGQC